MKFMNLPDGDDPDSFIQKNNKRNFIITPNSL